MTVHLTPADLNALADGELSTAQLTAVTTNLANCPACTTNALSQTLLKSHVARAGQRYAMPAGLEQRIKRAASSGRTGGISAAAGPAVAAAILLVLFSAAILSFKIATVKDRAEVSEVYDLHVATLAAGRDPQVLSSERHTVKPWFQGKLPFSFNLPDELPNDTRLAGANLTYLRSAPTAQLLYTIGQHRVSVFLAQISGSKEEGRSEKSGFKVIEEDAGNLHIVAVSDVDTTRLAELVRIIKDAQTP